MYLTLLLLVSLVIFCILHRMKPDSDFIAWIAIFLAIGAGMAILILVFAYIGFLEGYAVLSAYPKVLAEYESSIEAGKAAIVTLNKPDELAIDISVENLKHSRAVVDLITQKRDLVEKYETRLRTYRGCRSFWFTRQYMPKPPPELWEVL